MSNGRPVRFQALFLAALIFSIGAGNAEPGGAARHRAWSLGADGVSFHDRSTPTKTVKIPLPGWMWLGPPHGCLPDLALGPRGEALVTSDVLPILWRIDPVTLAVSVHRLALDGDAGRDGGFTGLVYSPEHRAYFAAGALYRSLWRIDPDLKTARRLPLTAPVPKGVGAASCKDHSLL
jgi:hypothetical protein